MFHNLLLSAFPSLINEAPLRNALISQFSDLGGNAKASLASLADPQNREVLNQIKFLHRAVSLLQVEQPLVHFAVAVADWLSDNLNLDFSLFCMFMGCTGELQHFMRTLTLPQKKKRLLMLLLLIRFPFCVARWSAPNVLFVETSFGIFDRYQASNTAPLKSWNLSPLGQKNCASIYICNDEVLHSATHRLYSCLFWNAEQLKWISKCFWKVGFFIAAVKNCNEST